MTKYNDYPIEECAVTADEVIKKGGTVYQKFTCSGCGSRQTMDKPNVFFESGTCQKCNALTDIKAQGCNYLVHGTSIDVLEPLLKR